VGLSLATEVPGTTVHLVELDPVALPWLERNVADYADRIDAAGSLVLVHHADAGLVHEGALAEIAGTVDLVTCNPPYIPDGAFPRDPEVREYDPAKALYGGPDGLDVVRAVAVSAAALLRAGGVLVMEHGEAQGESAGQLGVPAVLREAGYLDVLDRVDLAGRDRYTVASRA
jgi:release factor glutamine methyltransferase